MVTNRISVLPQIFQFQNYVNFDTRLSAQYVFHSAEIKSIFPCQIRGILRNPLVWKTLWKLWITHRRISLLNLLCKSVSFDQTLPHRGGFCRERGYFDGFSQLPSCLLIFIFAVLPNHKSLSAHAFCRSSAKYTICIETVKALPISEMTPKS